MDLQEPERKMSTTGGTEAGTVLVLDEPDGDPQEARQRRHRLRARGRPRRRTRRGSTNLIDILAVARGVDQDEIEREFEGAGYGDFKKAVAEAVVELLAPVRERYAELRPDEAALEAALGAGAEKARAIAAADARRGARAHGLRSPVSPIAGSRHGVPAALAGPVTVPISTSISTSTSSPGRSTC